VDGFHHVMSRALVGRALFLDDRDRTAFLGHVEDCVVRHRWRCVAYCLMDTHYHVLVQTPLANLAPGMRDLNGDYAQGFNRRHGLAGPVFRDRYRSQLVQDDAYLLAAARYIALNPVRAQMTRRAEDWPWSSFAAFRAGVSPEFVDHQPLLEVLSADAARARRELIDMIHEGYGLPTFDSATPVVGDARFVARHAPSEPPAAPVAQTVWRQARPPLADVLTGRSRDEAVAVARRKYRYTLREIADALGCSTQTVRRRLAVSHVRT
jgi:REP element-mobilizing transposase RayT